MRVHIGAHKTATTHFQANLEAIASELAEQDIVVLAHGQARRAVRFAAHSSGITLRALRRRLWLRFLGVPGLRRLVAASAPLVAYSDEDFLGWTQDLFDIDFYSDLAGLSVLPMIQGDRRLVLYLSVRSYDKLMSSAFFEVLKIMPDARAKCDAAVARLLSGHASGWVGLAERISSCLPAAELRFWLQEDYARDPHGILEQFLGRRLPALPPIERPAETASPAPTALAEVEKLDPSLNMEARHASVMAIYRANPAKGSGTILDAATSERLRAIYAEHVTILASRFRQLGTAT